MRTPFAPARAARRTVVAVLVLAAAFVACAREARSQFRCEAWTTADGLPHKSVHAILQTRDGYLWLATTDGLVRFDGARFTIFDTSGGLGLG